jgi:hypothetical protein
VAALRYEMAGQMACQKELMTCHYAVQSGFLPGNPMLAGKMQSCDKTTQPNGMSIFIKTHQYNSNNTESIFLYQVTHFLNQIKIQPSTIKVLAQLTFSHLKNTAMALYRPTSIIVALQKLIDI